MAWSLRRRQRREPVTASGPAPIGPAAPPRGGETVTAADLAARSRPEWSKVAPPTPLIGAMPLTISTRFDQVLPSRRRPDPVILGTLGHLIDPSGPRGTVTSGAVVTRPSIAPESSPDTGRPDLSLAMSISDEEGEVTAPQRLQAAPLEAHGPPAGIRRPGSSPAPTRPGVVVPHGRPGGLVRSVMRGGPVLEIAPDPSVPVPAPRSIATLPSANGPIGNTPDLGAVLPPGASAGSPASPSTDRPVGTDHAPPPAMPLVSPLAQSGPHPGAGSVLPLAQAAPGATVGPDVPADPTVAPMNTPSRSAGGPDSGVEKPASTAGLGRPMPKPTGGIQPAASPTTAATSAPVTAAPVDSKSAHAESGA